MIVPPRMGPNGKVSTGLTVITPDSGAPTAAMASGLPANAVGRLAAPGDAAGLAAAVGLAATVGCGLGLTATGLLAGVGIGDGLGSTPIGDGEGGPAVGIGAGTNASLPPVPSMWL